jgi:hypothetical protein
MPEGSICEPMMDKTGDLAEMNIERGSAGGEEQRLHVKNIFVTLITWIPRFEIWIKMSTGR